MTAHDERDLGAASEHFLEDAGVTRSGVFAQRLQAQDVAQTLDHRRLARAAATHQHVQIRVETHVHAVQKAALPRHLDELRVILGRRITVQANP